MRAFVVAAVTVAALTGPAYSQGPGKGGPEPTRPGEEPRPVVDEKKYKAAVGVIPEPKQKYDPWQNVREKPPEKAPAK